MTSSADGPVETAGHWGCRSVRPDGSTGAFYGVHSALHPDRADISLPEAEALAAVGDDAICIARFDDDGRVRAVEVMPHMAPKAPPIWFAELPELDRTPPASNLLAFTGHGIEPGTLLDEQALREVPVTSEDQLGAARWYPATGEADQVYVSPQWRRRTIGSALLVAISTLTTARGLNSIWSDGQRTADGERFRKARPHWSYRAGELTHLAPPMTPFEDR